MQNDLGNTPLYFSLIPWSPMESEGTVHVKERIEALEKKIAELEAQIKASKTSESSQFELVNMKNMTPTVLKDGTAFRVSC